MTICEKKEKKVKDKMRQSGEVKSSRGTPPSPSYMSKDEFGTAYAAD